LLDASIREEPKHAAQVPETGGFGYTPSWLSDPPGRGTVGTGMTGPAGLLPQLGVRWRGRRRA